MPRSTRTPRRSTRKIPIQYMHCESSAVVASAPYAPIDSENGEVRLLELAPGQFDDEIVMRLIPHNLTAEAFLHNYEALSYVWGMETSPRKAVLNDVSITIKANLDCALRHLRFTMVPRTLWVDAISINQASTQERNHQVQIMGRIYSTAKEVIIWLGPVDRSDLYLRAVLGAMQFHFSDKNSSTATFFDYIMSVIALMSEQIASREDPRAILLATLHRIVSRPWFTRIWVVQELALSKIANVRIGNYHFPWKPFAAFMSWLPHHKLDPARHGTLTEAVARVTRAQTDIHFSSQLCRTVHLSATDPRDKVFSLLGISGFSGERIGPDYTKSIQRVFSEAMAAVLKDGQLAIYWYAPLHPLRNAHDLGRLDGLPSWVPDFRILGAAYLKTMAGNVYDEFNRDEAFHRPYNVLTWDNNITDLIDEHISCLCVPLRFPPAIVSSDLTMLHVPGVVIGIIHATSGGTFYHHGDSYDEMILQERVRDLYRVLVQPHGIDPLEFFSILSRRIIKSNPTPPDFRLSQEACVELLKLDTSQADVSRAVLRRMNDIWSSVINNIYQRTFFITKNGRMCISYHPDHINGIRANDIVVGLFGINFPFILRPLDDGTYQMINVVGLYDHYWGHNMLGNGSESHNGLYGDSANFRQRNHGWRSGPRKYDEGASWEDYKEHGMVEFTIV